MSALLIATEAGSSGEHLPFYIAAGLLALWAVTIGGIGIARKTFPTSSGATWAIGGITAVLVIATVGLAIGTAVKFDNPTPRPENVVGVVPQPGESMAPADGAADAGATAKADPADAGGKVFVSAGCGACHVLKAAGSVGKIGPSLEGVGADPAAMIKKSIVNPNAEIQAGYAANIMPATFSKTLSADQIDSLVAYLQKVAS